MSLDTLLSELTKAGVQLRLATDDRLSVSAPKGSVNETLRAHIAEHKSVLIEWLKQHRDAESIDEAIPSIVPDPARWYEPFLMADLQASFLVGQNEDMEYYVRPHFYIENDFAELDVERFEATLNAVLYQQRHNLPLLRPDLQLQVPLVWQPLKLKVDDLRHLTADEAQTALLKTRDAMSREILPLDRWPSEDFRVSRYAGARVRLHINHNNFFGDGYGTMKLFATIMECYRRPRPLPELSLAFRDCVLALARLEASLLGQASRRYWEERLAALPGPPSIPLAAGHVARRRSFLSCRKLRLPASQWARFKQFAYRFGITPSNALTAVYAEIISSWSGSRHFLFNHMVTHRFPMHPQIMEVYGNFASLYPLEVDWRAHETFHQRAQRLQTRLTTDMRHLYWSGMKVLQALNQAQKTPGRAPCPFVVGSGLFIKEWEEFYFSCLETSQVLLDYQFWEVPDGSLLVSWDAIEACFPSGLIDAMQHGYETLLAKLADDEAAWRRSSFDLLPSAQRDQRARINETSYPLYEALLTQGLSTSADGFPERPAVITDERTLTYAELYAAANRLAQCLKQAGAQPGERIAILLEKGSEQAVAVFGILAVGAAYVPIDPHWPAERVHFVLKNIDARAVVTSRRLQTVSVILDSFPTARGGSEEGHRDVRAVYVDDIERSPFADAPLLATRRATDLAYIIYTSGSTGVPKGVMIDHGGALNTVLDINRRFGVTKDDVIFGVSSLCFDLSVYDLFGAAAAGATLVLPSTTPEPEPARWIDSIQQHAVTVWNSVPALMQLLVDAAAIVGAQLPSLRLVMLSGDWIPVALPAQIKRVAPNARIVSLGGATEASIWSIYYPIEHVDSSWVSIPYGKPLANQTWHVLDENGEDAPIWAPGYLYIGGRGLALGYWGDPQKTDAVFVPHPRTGERLYRTGDLGRYLPDGNIEFLGRADLQVKIQGYRVELGEIEAVLVQHSQVQAAAVIVSVTPVGKQLVAFVVADAGSRASLSLHALPARENAIPSGAWVEMKDALQRYLRTKLPAYMLPSHIVPLAQLPLTANGKVDRAALAKLGPAGQAKREFVAPRNDTERKLAAIWQEVLAVKPVGVHDDFFDLGGQSFAAVRVMTRIEQECGRRLPLGLLLEDGTIETLARRLQKQATWSPLVPLRTTGEGAPCFFVHPAGGNVLCYRGLAQKLDRPFYGLQAPGLFGEQPPLESIEQMAALYLAAIRKRRPRGPYLLGGWSSGGAIAFEMARQLESTGEEVERVVMIDAAAPMQDGPVDNVTLLRWFLEDFDVGIDVSCLRREDVEVEPERALVLALDLMRAHRSIHANLDSQQLVYMLAIFTRTVRAARRYRPTPITADISVLRAADGSVGEFSDHPSLTAEDWGWLGFTSGAVHCARVPGTHYTVLSESNVDTVAAVVRSHLERKRFPQAIDCG
ncbi:MAG: amino acid adenylation domain-containing protein [Gammaproteobacteria bacterium]|nr:amino acid adenylation domain-containing protein [Gammaproteobacteria bacterium]